MKIISRDDQRELNNLGKMIPEQGQGHMMVIDEAKAAHDLLAIAKELPRMNPREKTYVDEEDGWHSVFGEDSGFCYGQFGSESQAQRKSDEIKSFRERL